MTLIYCLSFRHLSKSQEFVLMLRCTKISGGLIMLLKIVQVNYEQSVFISSILVGVFAHLAFCTQGQCLCTVCVQWVVVHVLCHGCFQPDRFALGGCGRRCSMPVICCCCRYLIWYLWRRACFVWRFPISSFQYCCVLGLFVKGL